jgi:hypothetical protein
MVGGYSATGMQHVISNTYESNNSKLDSNKSHASYNTQGTQGRPSITAAPCACSTSDDACCCCWG